MKRNLNNTIEQDLLQSSLWLKKLDVDCRDQNVFLTIRDNRVDLYHKGGKLFGFDKDGYKTHIKYAAVINKLKEDYLTEKKLAGYKLISNFEKGYTRIKENCGKYSGLEASGVSKIYHKHSYFDHSDIIVLDIEVSFKSAIKDRKQDRIDILLYDKKTRTLQFVEAKHYSNKELWSTTTPDVIKQIRRYENQISINKASLINEYSNYISILNNIFNNIFNKKLPKPLHINPEVILLVFGFDKDQQQGRLKTLIQNNIQYKGVKLYSKGNIGLVKLQNLWNTKVL